MTHPEMATLLAHVDRELPDREWNDVATHVASCATCSQTISGLRETSDALGVSLRALDAAEPERWHSRPAISDAQVIPFAPRQLVRSVPRTAWLRRAAAVLLLTGAAASAAVLTGEWRTQTAETHTTPAVVTPTMSITPVAAVSVAPVNGQVSISISGAGTGSQLFVTLVERDDADVAIESQAAPHFTATDGRVAVEMDGAAAIVRVSLPQQLREAIVTANGRVLVTVADGQITPTPATDVGIPFGTRTILPDE